MYRVFANAVTAGKASLRSAVKAAGSVYRAKDSWCYRLYLSVFYRQEFNCRKAERSFYRGVLGKQRAELVFDIGANSGSKAIIFTALAKRVVCVEPSPQCVEILRERFLKQTRVIVVPKGVGATSRIEKFYLFDETSALNTFAKSWVGQVRSHEMHGQTASSPMPREIEVPIVTLDSLIAEFGVPTYVKIDVEGFELEALRGLSRPVSLVSFECNLPAFAADTIECLSILGSLVPAMRFNYCLEEPPTKFHGESWCSHVEMARIVQEIDREYMEIWGRMP